MSAPTDARKALAATLTAVAPPEATVWDHVPDDLNGRDVVLQPGPNYLVPSDTMTGTEYVLTLEVHLLVSGLGNQETHESVDDLLAFVLPAIVGSRAWVISGMTRLDAFATSEWTTYGIAVTVQRYIQLTTELRDS